MPVSDESVSLKAVCQVQVFTEILHAINGSPDLAAGGTSGYKVLLLDRFATKIISSCCKMSGITEAGVSHVENLLQPRQPLPMLEAIYFMSPEKECVEALCNDFRPGKGPHYARAHIVFTGHLSDRLLHRISENSALTERIATLKELNMEFMAVEDQVFSLDMPESFYHLYAPPSAVPAPNPASTHSRIARRLGSLCITLGDERGDVPLIRYQEGSEAARGVASALHRELRRFVDHGRDVSRGVLQKNADRHNTGARATVLVVDRANDLAAPLLHELTYQAMCHDVLDVSESGVISREIVTQQGETETKKDVLSEEDWLWAQFKHMHIATVLGVLPHEFKQFTDRSEIAQHQAKKSRGEGNAMMDTGDMSRVVKELPEYRKKYDKYSMHINLTAQLLKIFTGRKLQEVCELEQNMLFDADASGNKLRPQTHREAVAKLLHQSDLSAEDRARLFAVSQITNASETQQLLSMDGVRVPEEYLQATANIDAVIGKSASTQGGEYQPRNWRTDKDDYPGYDKGRNPTEKTSRYKPALYWTGKDAIDPGYGLSEAVYPYVEAPPPHQKPVPFMAAGGGASRRTGTDWRGKRVSRGPRLILFVVGGMSYSECRAAYELSQKFPGTEVLIGSTELLTPQSLLERMKLEEYPNTRLSNTAGAGLEDGSGLNASGAEELSTFDQFLDWLPFERIFPCCFPSPENPRQPLLQLNRYPTTEASASFNRDSQSEDRELLSSSSRT